MALRYGLDLTARVDAIGPPVRSCQVGGIIYHFYRHPYLFRHGDVIDWVDYEYNNLDILRKKDIHDYNPCWLQMKNIYESYLGESLEIKRNESANG